jgi:ElaB/YqjD/DUF883 family membrane-anchored ribosome-binding protein
MTKTQDKTKIHEALELLNTVAAEEQSELKDIINDRYDTLKEFVGTLGHDVQRELTGAVESGRAHAHAASAEAVDHAHANMWAYVAGSAALGLLAGVWIMRPQT